MTDNAQKKTGALKKAFYAAAIGLPVIAAAGVGYAWYNGTDRYSVSQDGPARVYTHAHEKYSDSYGPFTSESAWSVKEVVVPDNGDMPQLRSRLDHTKYVLGIQTSRKNYGTDVVPVTADKIGKLEEIAGERFDDAKAVMNDVRASDKRKILLQSESVLRKALADTPKVVNAFNTKYGSYPQAEALLDRLYAKSHADVRELLGMDPSTIQMRHVQVDDGTKRVYDGQDCRLTPSRIGKMTIMQSHCSARYRSVPQSHTEARLPPDIQARLDAARHPFAVQASEVAGDMAEYTFFTTQVPSLVDEMGKSGDLEAAFVKKYVSREEALSLADRLLLDDVKAVAREYEQKSREIPLVTPLLRALQPKGPGL